MNKIITTDVVDPLVQQPFTADSLDFLQDANKEMIKAYALSVIGKIYDTTKYYIISGLDFYGTHQYTEGYVFHNGELYYCPGKSTTTAFVNTPVLNLVETNAPFDPVIFSDNTSHSVHKIRRFVMVDASSGSGTVDYFNCIFIDRPITAIPVLKAYDSSNTEVVGGVTASGFNRTFYTLNGNSLNVTLKSQVFVIASGVRYITVEMPFPFPVSTLSMYGTCIVAFQRLGTTTGFNGIAEIEYGVITIKNLLINTDIPAMPSDGCVYMSITAIIG